MSTPNRGKKVSVESIDKSPKNFRWSQPYEDTLLELLLREARKGNRPDNTFTATAFRNIVADFNRIHDTSIMKKHVLSRIKTIKLHFNLFHGAFNGLSGFAWNDETKMFEAEDCVWEQRIKDNPQLEKVRDKPCFNWDKLLELYGDTCANGAQAIGLKGVSSAIQRGLNFADLCLDSDEQYVGTHSPNEYSSFGNNTFSKDDAEPSSTPQVVSSQQSGGTSRPSRKRKASLISVLEDGYKTMASSIRYLSITLTGTGEKVAGTRYDPLQNEEIYAALDNLGLDENYKLKCYCYLTSHPSKAAQIVGAPTGIRGKLLDAFMNGPAED